MKSQTIHFYKMEGAGNDYIYVNTLTYPTSKPEEVAKTLSQSHFGIGSDGLVLLCPPTDPTLADFRMRIFNADGSEALMCGNASRCVGKLIYEKRWSEKNPIRLETLSGVKELRLRLSADKEHVEEVTVDMLEPQFSVPELFTDDYATVAGTAMDAGLGDLLLTGELELGSFVSMGNPHFVFFVEDLKRIDLAKAGPLLERCEAFPERCNVEFAQLTGKDQLRVRVWERGSGITLACGTGACASAVAAAKSGKTAETCTIQMDGGRLKASWQRKKDNHVMLSGPARLVFEGDVEINI